MTFSTWGQTPLLSTAVAASPAPTTTAFGVGSVAGLRIGHIVRIDDTHERTITGIAGLVLTISPALSAPPSAADTVVCYATDATNARLNGMAIWDVESTTALSATPDAGMDNGTRAQVKDGAFYRLDTGSSATVDGYMVLATHSGTGRWLIQIGGGGTAQTVTSDTAMANGGSYIVGGSTRRTMTLPSSPAIGPVNEVVAEGTGGFKIALNSGQTLRYQNNSYAYGYLLQNTDAYAAVRIRCTATNQFTVVGHEGAIVFGAAGAGYVAGGSTGSDVATISKLTYSTESRSTLGATLGASRNFQGGSAGISGSAKGYYAGQTNAGTPTTAIDDQDFSSDASATLAAVLGTARYGLGTGASGTHGYLLGGRTGGGAYSTLNEKIQLSNDTISTVTDTLDVGKAVSGPVQSSTKIYLLAGDKSGENPSNDVEEFVLATEISTLLGATMPAAVYLTAAVHSATAGYLLGGFEGAAVATIRKFTFASETSSTPSATLDTAKNNQAAVRSSVKGYCVGGAAGSLTAVIEDLDFATELSVAISATLAAATEHAQGVSALA